jgi:hypothetical protein
MLSSTFIDEIGYLPLDELGATIFSQLVSARYERGSIILTSNKSFGDWGTIFGDPIIATAILDRLLHDSTTINIRGESYRLKDRRKAGLFPRAEEQADRPAPFPSPETVQNGPRRQGSPGPRQTGALDGCGPLWKRGFHYQGNGADERGLCKPPVGRLWHFRVGEISIGTMGNFQPELTNGSNPFRDDHPPGSRPNRGRGRLTPSPPGSSSRPSHSKDGSLRISSGWERRKVLIASMKGSQMSKSLFGPPFPLIPLVFEEFERRKSSNGSSSFVCRDPSCHFASLIIMVSSFRCSGSVCSRKAWQALLVRRRMSRPVVSGGSWAFRVSASLRSLSVICERMVWPFSS